MAFDTGILIVFTAKTPEQILEAGGSQSWVLNQHSMRGVEYVVCTRNSDPAYDEECGVRREPHNAAFMVGKVSGMTKVDHRNDRDRYRVDFSEYAIVSVPDFRHGSSRNPVTYGDVGQAKQNGLDIEALEFLPMPSGNNEEPPTNGAGMKGLTIAQAKDGLSIQFGVPIESIQITISG
jgi:hypothetical protein